MGISENTSRRAVLAGIASAAALPIAAAAPLVHDAVQHDDPIFAALDAYRCVAADFYGDHPEWGGNVPEEIGERWSAAKDLVFRTQPTTPAGLVALTGFARNLAERSDYDAGLGDGEWVRAIATIDDAARGMSGLKPWAPPAVDTSANPDAELLALIKEFERLNELEKPLHAKFESLEDRSDRLRYVRLGVDPDNKRACDRAAKNRYKEWLDKKTETNKETGRDKAYDEWHEATKRTARLGRKILRIPAATMDGLLVRMRVVEVEKDSLPDEPEKLLLKEVRRFAKRVA